MFSPLNKPAQWGFDPGFVSLKHAWFWNKVAISFPLWERAGDPRDLSQRKTFARSDAVGGDGPNWKQSEVGPVLDFLADTTRDFIDMPSILADISGTSYSFEILLQVDAFDGSGIVLFGTNTTTNVFFQLGDASGDPVDAIWVGATSVTVSPSITFIGTGFRHIIMVSDGTGVEFWVDDILRETSATPGASLATGAKNFALGKWLGGVNWDFDGQIALANFFSSRLTRGEIHQRFIDPFGSFRMMDQMALLVPAAVTAPTINLVMAPYAPA